jgi:hypothetical protein
MSAQKIMPAFAFGRRHDIELEVGLILAGQLVVDLPRGTEPTEDQQQMIGEIVRWLMEDAKSGRLPADAMVYGWHGGGGRPPDAVDTDNDEVMLAWANTRLVIGLRVDPRNDGMLRIDSDMMRQMGLPEPRGGGEPAS